MKAINNRNDGQYLYEVIITLKGETEKTAVYVYAENRLQASNALILRKILGKQHEIKLANNVHLMK